MSIPVRFKFDASNCLGTLELLKQEVSSPAAKGLKPGFLAAAKTYSLFIVRRFLRFSSGGGSWRALKPATVRAKGSRRILRDTDRLLRSLYPGGAGNVMSVDRRGATVGTMVPYARFHNVGTGTIPKRQIYVRPDQQTRQAMAQDMRKALAAAVKRAITRGGGRRRPAA